jgi:hypothetical protein
MKELPHTGILTLLAGRVPCCFLVVSVPESYTVQHDAQLKET